MIFRKNQSGTQAAGGNLPRPKYETAYASAPDEFDASLLPRACAFLCALMVVILDWNSTEPALNRFYSSAVLGMVAGAVGVLIGKLINALLTGWKAWGVLFAMLLIGVVGWNYYTASPPRALADAEKEALQWYPQLGVANSPLNRAFVARYNWYRATNRSYFSDPHWGVKLAAECEADLAKGNAQK